MLPLGSILFDINAALYAIPHCLLEMLSAFGFSSNVLADSIPISRTISSQPPLQAHFLHLTPLNVDIPPWDSFLGPLLLSLSVLFAAGSFYSHSPNYHLEVDGSQASLTAEV